MIYFDSDVVFNALILQDHRKYEESNDLIFEAMNEGKIALSSLLVQELGYSMGKKGMAEEVVEEHLAGIMQNFLTSVNHQHMVRAVSLATKIGFKHINDCIHTAVAESLSCEKLYTYNKSDFKRIQKHTGLNIVIFVKTPAATLSIAFHDLGIKKTCSNE